MKYILIALTILLNTPTWAGNTGVKNAPAGLVLRGKTKTSYCDLPRSGVDGGYCQISWADLEPREGKYDFHLIRNALKKAKAYNRRHNANFKVLLRIRTGIYSPKWLLKKVGSINWYFRNTSDKYALPIFWEAPFQYQYKKLMKKLADQFDNTSNIGLVAASMCMTKNTEIMWNRTGRTEVNSLNMENLIHARDARGNLVPYTNAKDFNCLKKQIDIHKYVWKRTPTIFGSHLYQQYNVHNGSHTPKYNPTLNLFDYCTNQLGKRCILGNNSLLHTENNTAYNINRAITRTARKGYNTYYQTHVMNPSFNFDNLIVAINHAASWGAMMVELPMGWDCPYGSETYYNPLTCTNASYKASFLRKGRNALKANFRK